MDAWVKVIEVTLHDVKVHVHIFDIPASDDITACGKRFPPSLVLIGQMSNYVKTVCGITGTRKGPEIAKIWLGLTRERFIRKPPY